MHAMEAKKQLYGACQYDRVQAGPDTAQAVSNAGREAQRAAKHEAVDRLYLSQCGPLATACTAQPHKRRPSSDRHAKWKAHNLQ